ncbi:MAG TPA: WS/DGAT domain-containing protein, partial [Thermopolyspora sp.]
RFAAVRFPLAVVRDLARLNGARVSDVLMGTVAGGLRRVLLERGMLSPGGTELLRISVPLMVRRPGDSPTGNLTAAVMMDLPLGPATEVERLAQTALDSRRLRGGTRALAARFVMGTLGQVLSPPAHAWFARTVYGGRFFQAIVSNIPGPPHGLSLAGAPLIGAYPILPLAPGAPLVVGAMGWNGELCLGVTTDPAFLPDAEPLATAILAAFEELRGHSALPEGRP